MTTRERQEKFIRKWGDVAVKTEISDIVRRHGLSVFHDEAILQMVQSLITKERLHQRMNRDNRAFLASAGRTA